jgi:hypothetical protein
MIHLPRGIAPELLLSQVKNTMPYLFAIQGDLSLSPVNPWSGFPPLDVLKSYESDSSRTLSHFDYFQLCVSSHFLTCATPVPTDVDNQIRFKLWPENLPLETAVQMARFVLEIRSWDFTLISRRYAYGAAGGDWEKQAIHGHMGEWFTVSAAAYCALKRYRDPMAQEQRQKLFENIVDEIRKHSEIFGSLWRANQGVECLKASAAISHNLGDLDRVMDMWELSVDDPLKLEYYKLGVLPFDSNRKLRFLGRLWVAGELYKSTIDGSSMALENHRHFALRKPRCLRKDAEFLVPNGPFFDAWGSKVARGLMRPDGTPSEETFEVVDALIQGWSRLPKTVGYGRALRSISEVHSDLNIQQLIQDKAHRRVLEVPQEKFEKTWDEAAVKWMDEIPSRA